MSANTQANKWLTLIAIAATGFLAVMDISITNISFPALTRVFNTDASVVLWTSAIYSLVSAGLTPIFGRIGDMYGRKKIFIIGISLFTIGLGLCSISQTILQLILARAVQGVGGAMIMVLTMAIITAVFPDKERGRALGILSACHLVGPLVGPTIGGLLLDAMGWRAIFYFRLPLCIIALILAIVLLKEQKGNNGSTKLDYLGAAVLVSGISCLVLFFNLGSRISFTEPAILALLTVSIILLVLFVIKARKTENSIVDLNLFKSRVFTVGVTASLFHSLSLSLRMLVIPYFLIDGLELPTAVAGLLMSVGSMFIITISPFSGWLSDKVGPKVLCPIGMALACLGTFLFSRLGPDATYLDIIIPQAISGTGNALFISPNTSMIMGSAPREKLGLASALMSTVRTIAQASGVVIAGTIFTLRQAIYLAELSGSGLGETTVTKLAIIGGFEDTVLVSAALFLAAALLTVFGLWKQPFR